MNIQTGSVRTPDGLRLAYDERGSGSPVVFVHGLGLDRRRWDGVADAAAGAGYRAITFDLRGFGESEDPPEAYGMDDLVTDLRCVADELAGGSLHLVGHSLGGMISLAFAVRRPDRLRSLTLASTTAHNGRRASRLARQMAFELADEDPGRAWAWRACDGFSVLDELDRIRCPALVLHGTEDPLMPLTFGEWLDEGLPESRFVTLEGAGHSVQVERAGVFAAELVEHLRGAEGAGRATP